jgi:hypothetical protein
LQNSIYGPEVQRLVCLFIFWFNNFYHTRIAVDDFEKPVLITSQSSSYIIVYQSKGEKWSLITMQMEFIGLLYNESDH